MNNKIKIITLTLFTSLLTLVGCDNSSSWEPGENAIEGALQPTNTNPTGELSDLNKMRISQNNFGLPSKGNPNILVVPLTFKNDVVVEKATGLDLTFDDKDISDINQLFFGEDKANLHSSVKSYYMKSSYGQLNIDGVVTPKLTYTEEFLDLVENVTYGTKTIEGVKEDILNFVYDKLFIETKTYNPEHFDSNKDGKIDSVHIVFNFPYYLAVTDDNNMTLSLHSLLTTLEPIFSSSLNEDTLFNSATLNSYGYYENNQYGAYSRIPISLIGNIIGLDSYADMVGTSDGQYRAPTGFVDMMDGYVGDHSAFSKYQLGWINPTVVSKNDIPLNQGMEVKLSKLEKEGDALVLCLDDEHTPFSEYLILEYYSPTGLNQMDASIMFKKAGIKVTHVDARLLRGYGDVYLPYDEEFDFDAEITLSNNEKVKYVYDYRHTNNYYNNYLDYGITSNNPLCLTLSKDGMNRHATSSSYGLSDEDLFHVNDTFGSDDQIEGFYKDFAFYDGEFLGIEFEVKELGETATITLRRAD